MTFSFIRCLISDVFRINIKKHVNKNAVDRDAFNFCNKMAFCVCFAKSIFDITLNSKEGNDLFSHGRFTNEMDILTEE